METKTSVCITSLWLTFKKFSMKNPLKTQKASLMTTEMSPIWPVQLILKEQSKMSVRPFMLTVSSLIIFRSSEHLFQ